MKKGEKVGKRQFKNEEKQKSYDEALQEYLLLCKRRNLSEHTIYGYRYIGERFAEWNNDKLIEKNTTLRYIDYLQSIDTKATSINSQIRKITPVLNYGWEMGYWCKVDFLQLKEDKEIKETYTQEELDLLLEHPTTKKFTEMRNWAITWTFAATGIRRSELLDLKVCSVNLLERTILLNKTKSRKARYVPISSGLADVLEEYLSLRNGKNSEYLFPTVYNTKMSTSSVNKELESYNTKMGVVSTGIHKFRHTFITRAVNENVNVLTLKKITGHSSMDILNGYYQAKVKDIVQIIDTIAPTSNGKKKKF